MPGGDPATTVSSPRPSIGPVMPNHKKKNNIPEKIPRQRPSHATYFACFLAGSRCFICLSPYGFTSHTRLPCLSYIMQASSVSPARVKCKGIKVKIGRVRDTREKSFPLPIGVSSFRPRPGCKCMLCVCVCSLIVRW